MENVAFVNPHLRKIIFKTHTQKVTRNSEKHRKTTKTKSKKNWYLGHTDFEHFRNCVSPILTKIILFKMIPYFVLYCLKHFGNN